MRMCGGALLQVRECAEMHALVAEGETKAVTDAVSTESRGSQFVDTRRASLPFQEYQLPNVVAEFGF